MEQTKFSKSVNWYNFILCIFIILIHAENTGIFTGAVPVLNKAEYIIVEKAARIAVAGFFMCSGYLFYRNFSWKKLGIKWKSRFFSTVIPFAVWNLLYYLLHLIVSNIPQLHGLFGSEAVPFNLGEIIQAVFFYKYNPVFWFLQFLIVFIYICPLIYLIICNRWTGLLGILVVYILASSQYMVEYNDTLAAMTNWIFIYMAGGYVGIHGKTLVEEGKKKGLIFFTALTGTLIAFIMYELIPSIGWTLMYYLFGAVFIWALLNLKELPEIRSWMKGTFYIYAVHFMVVQFGNKFAHYIWGDSMYIGIAMFVLLPVIVIVFCAVTGNLMSRYVPIIWKILSGSR